VQNGRMVMEVDMQNVCMELGVGNVNGNQFGIGQSGQGEVPSGRMTGTHSAGSRVLSGEVLNIF
jgi:hypothetical protein